jgi:hypothetical protein
MSWHAYGDESERGSTYLLAAAVFETAAEDAARATMVSLQQPGQTKVHWHDESSARRRKIVSAVASIDALHVVVVSDGAAAERPERRRVKCLQRLIRELDAAGVTRLYLEAREQKQNAGDRRVLDVMRSVGWVSSELGLHHPAGPAEPLLWVADTVAGAVASAWRGRYEYLDDLLHLLQILSAEP